MRSKETLSERRKRRTRYKISTVANGRPRLTVFRSNSHIYAQVVDDSKGITLAAASTLDKELAKKIKNGNNVDAAVAVGELVAKRAKTAKVEAVVFDKGAYIYHGRVKALADAARAGGLKF